MKTDHQNKSILLVDNWMNAAATVKIEQPSRALSSSKHSHLKPQLRHSSIVSGLRCGEIGSRFEYKFVSARRPFDLAQDRLHQVAAATAPQFSAVTSAFDDFSWQPYDKLWRINVLRVVVSFLFRIPILWINARGIWYLVAGR